MNKDQLRDLRLLARQGLLVLIERDAIDAANLVHAASCLKSLEDEINKPAPEPEKKDAE